MSENGGPLSYTVPETGGEVSAQRPILVGSGVAIGLGLVVTVVGWLLMAVLPSRTLVVRGSALVVVAGAEAVALAMTVTGLRRRRRNALVGVGVVAVVVAIVASQVLDLAKPTFPQLRAALAAYHAPEGMVSVSEERSGRRTCPPNAITRVYRAPQPLADPVGAVMDAFFDQGWAYGDPNAPRAAQTTARKGPYLADVYETGTKTDVRVIMTSAAGRCG